MNTDNFQGIKVGEELYDFVPDEHRLAAEFIHKLWVRAGRPDRLEGESAWKVVDGIFQIWGALFPAELKSFAKEVQDDQSIERTVSEATRRDGGYIPISYPTRLFQMIRLYFHDDKLQDRNTIIKFVRRYPLLKRTKYNI